MIAKQYLNILKLVRPYLLGNMNAFERFSFDVFGKTFLKEDILNCLDSKNSQFFRLLQKLDGLSFGPQGMGMDKWVFFDCAAMPSGIFGFGIERAYCPQTLLDKLEVDVSYKGLIPISMYMAIPVADGLHWFGHNLSSLKSYLDPEKFKGLGLLTKAYGIQVYNMQHALGATQWGSPALEVHLQLADMEILASTLSGHTYETSLCYKSLYTKEKLLVALNGHKRIAEDYDFLMDSTDYTAQKDLQKKIEKGERFSICGRPIHKSDKVFYPLKALP